MHMPDAAHADTDQDSSFCGTEGGNGVRIQGDSAATSLQEYERGQDTEKAGGAPCWASGTQANTVSRGPRHTGWSQDVEPRRTLTPLGGTEVPPFRRWPMPRQIRIWARVKMWRPERRRGEPKTHYASAIISISTRKSRGRRETSTVVRAGGLPGK